MGTTAELAVIHRGRALFFSTSYDGYAQGVLPQICGTIAACGMEALRAHLDRIDTTGCLQDTNMVLDWETMGTTYLEACRQRGRDPLLLDLVLTYDYGIPDFAHGGVVPLFAPQLDLVPASEEMCVDRVPYILDLDREVLATTWLSETDDEGRYDDGTLDVCRINLGDVEALDPVVVFSQVEHVIQEHLDNNNSSSRDLEHHLARALNPLSWETIPAVSSKLGHNLFRQAPAATEGRFHDKDLSSVHVLRGEMLQGSAKHLVVAELAVAFLRDMASTGSGLGGTGAVLQGVHAQGGACLVVDLRRQADSKTAQMVSDLFGSLVKRLRMHYSLYCSNGRKLEMTPGRYSSGDHAFFDRREAVWDEKVIPQGVFPIALEQPSWIDLNLQDPQTLAYCWQMTIAAMDNAAWDLLVDAGFPLPDQRGLQDCCHLFVQWARLCEAAAAGSTRVRFERLDQDRQRVILDHMGALDRYVFDQLTAPVKELAPSSKRRAGP